MIVSRAFPSKGRGVTLWVEKDILVVEPRIAVALAEVIREGIIEIGRLRITGEGRERKGQDLLKYITSDEFRTRFFEIATMIEDLRVQQQKERDSHARVWETETACYERMMEGHRKIRARIKSITEAGLVIAMPRTRRTATS